MYLVFFSRNSVSVVLTQLSIQLHWTGVKKHMCLQSA